MSNPNPNPNPVPTVAIKVIDFDNPETQKLVAALKDAKKPKKPSWTIKLKDQVAYDQAYLEYQYQLYAWEFANNKPHAPTVGTYLKVVGTALLAIGGGVGLVKSFNKENNSTEMIPETTSTNDDVIE